jgi:hypothetical protein
MAINLSPLGADLNAWLYQAAEEGRDMDSLQRQVNDTCSKTYKTPEQATVALLDLSETFKGAGFTDESNPLMLVAEQIDVLAKAAIPQEEGHDDVVELVEHRIARIQGNWARAEAEAGVNEEQDAELREVKKRSWGEAEEGYRAMLLEAHDVLNDIKRQRTEKEDEAKPAPEAPLAAAPTEKPVANSAPSEKEAPAEKPKEAVTPSNDSAAPAAEEPKAQ